MNLGARFRRAGGAEINGGKCGCGESEVGAITLRESPCTVGRAPRAEWGSCSSQESQRRQSPPSFPQTAEHPCRRACRVWGDTLVKEVKESRVQQKIRQGKLSGGRPARGLRAKLGRFGAYISWQSVASQNFARGTAAASHTYSLWLSVVRGRKRREGVAPHSPFKPNRAGRPSLDHCASMLGRPKIKVVTEVRILIIPADATGGWVDIRVRPANREQPTS